MVDDDNSAMPITLDSNRLRGAVALADWGLIRAAGEDARSFLHGQLTQDVLHLESQQARLAGYCSAKGRLQASFVVWRSTPDELFLACSSDVLPVVLKRLSMFVLRQKCKLSDVSSEWRLWGVAGDPPAASTAGDKPWSKADVEGRTVIRLPDALVGDRRIPRWLVAQAAATAAPSPAGLDADTWRWLEVRSGTPRITAATADLFVPQMINFELVGGVHFQKGCYPGQEVVARSQYRGTLKRRGYVLEGDAALQSAQELFHSADPDQPAGQVVLAASVDGRHAAFAELKIAAAAGGGELHAGSITGPTVVLGSLPYPIPAEAA